MSHRTKLVLAYITSGWLLGIGFVAWQFWSFGLLAIAIFFYALSQTGSRRGTVIGGSIVWGIKSLFAISWFWSTYPIDWMILSVGRAELLLIGFYWFTVSTFLAGGGALFGLIYFEIKKRVKNVYYGLILIPLVWVASEIVGSFLFSVGTFGDGGTINTVFSFGYVGYLLGTHEGLIQLAKVGGVYALSFSAVVMGYGLYLGSLKFSLQKIVWGIGGTLIFLTVSGLPLLYSDIPNKVVPDMTVAIIDTSFGGKSFYQRDNALTYKSMQLNEAVTAALELKPDYILLPEDSRFFSANTSVEMSIRLFRFLHANSESVIIDSGRTPITNGEVVLRATIYDGTAKESYAVDKQYLVPQGEFLPQFYLISLTALGGGEMIKRIGKQLAYRPGPFASQTILSKHIPGVLFCFESTDPQGVSKLIAERDVPFIAHPISHAWFHESQVLWQQQDVMLKVQALWSGVHIVSAGNMAYGALYTKNGRKVIPEKVANGESWQVGLISW
jgi:apolipoprotein N-acyltransferase